MEKNLHTSDMKARLHRLSAAALELLVRLKKWVLHTNQESPVETEPEWELLTELADQFLPIRGIDYKPVKLYVEKIDLENRESDKIVDAKADNIIRYLGGGSALVLVGTFLSFKSDASGPAFTTWLSLLCLSPSLYFAIAAITTASEVCNPKRYAVLPSVREFLSQYEAYSKLFGNETGLPLDADRSSAFYIVLQGRTVWYNSQVLRRKSDLLTRAYASYRKAVIMLTLPFVVFIVSVLANVIRK
jgi:hypothetical protein